MSTPSPYAHDHAFAPAAGHLTVIGCGLGPDDLTPRHRAAAAEADIIAGGRRLLAWFPACNGTRMVIDRHIEELVAELVAAVENGRRVAVPASGDGLFFGIARRFTAALPPESITILPNVSAAQAACARLGLPWEAGRFFSLHGRDNHSLPWGEILRAGPAVIFGDPRHPAAAIAPKLAAAYPQAAGRRAAVMENLGGPDETIRTGTLAELGQLECGGLSLLLVRPPANNGPVDSPPLALGRETDVYAHQRGLITNPEIRAAVLAKLRPGPGIMWDLGAGSGSVAVEVCGLDPHIAAYAVEREPERTAQIRANADAAGVSSRLTVITGDIIENLDTLPAPRSIFIGGGGDRIADIARRAFAKLRPGGVMVIVAVLLETRARLLELLPANRRELVEISVRRAAPVAGRTMFKPDNPVLIGVWEKELLITEPQPSETHPCPSHPAG
ncbi:MAG: precorrin-6y C5,15-methyltransferase (decarboxylating) subunit CbiE [Deltaproteobacteria bacterium]|nr:precorrin-6y C5,15-methyltransferase (decarboxylating) subunit CbiE [Candidatus Anaeroferrophillacea bacterium]